MPLSSRAPGAQGSSRGSTQIRHGCRSTGAAAPKAGGLALPGAPSGGGRAGGCRGEPHDHHRSPAKAHGLHWGRGTDSRGSSAAGRSSGPQEGETPGPNRSPQRRGRAADHRAEGWRGEGQPKAASGKGRRRATARRSRGPTDRLTCSGRRQRPRQGPPRGPQCAKRAAPPGPTRARYSAKRRATRRALRKPLGLCPVYRSSEPVAGASGQRGPNLCGGFAPGVASLHGRY